ncbi:MAG: hydantoinase/oxoprolinase family protein [Actinobacteria bacterium]|nr:hydantoinase/oxoprolinase family protein [Actinomycetota bacterium]
MRRIGVDVGGTFTDLVFWDDATETSITHKTPSTPADPSQAIIKGILELCGKAECDPSSVDMVFHGTTVATNIALEHNGSRVGLITTEGFRDILHIARKKRPYNFSSYQDLPWQSFPLVRRRDRMTVRERITADGRVECPLDREGARGAIRSLKEAGVDAVAVCFLHAYSNPVHEEEVKELLAAEFPEAFVSLSSEVAPQYREYERFSTTALNAYIGPKVSRYLGNLAREAGGKGVSEEIHLMASAGGVVTLDSAAERPVSLLMSGPVAGLLAGCEIGRASGRRSVITLDVGGTSADVGVAPDGELRMKHLLDTKIGPYDAMVPMAEVDTIGAGGGSIAFVDKGGMFSVGPRSAGADPGPACYGRGGTEPTSTDAMVVLGWLRPENFLGGALDIDAGAARAAIEARIARELDTSVEYAATGIFQILSNSMGEAVSLQSVRKGFDPRDFVLVPQGGAGPLFGWDVARQLQIPRVVVPGHPGIASAIGLLTTDMRYEFPATVWESSDGADLERIEAEFRRLAELALSQLRADGLGDEAIAIQRTADCRYVGQGYELRVNVPDGPVTPAWIAQTVAAFGDAHERAYSRRFDDVAVQIVNIRVIGVGTVAKHEIPRLEGPGSDAERALKQTVSAFFPDESSPEPLEHETAVYDRALLGPGASFAGPAIVEQYDSTTIVGPGQAAAVDEVGHLIIEGVAA